MLIATISMSVGPPNCNLYESDCRRACEECEQAIQYSQGSAPSQYHFDRSIEICPSFDYAYYEKAVPFAKRGQMREWKVLIDQAVALDSATHLGTRSWYHFFFAHNYRACLADLDLLDQLVDGDIGRTGDGFQHLNVLRALCYHGLGEPQRAYDLIVQQIATPDYIIGQYDELYAGMIALELEQPDIALAHLARQTELDDIADLYYYVGKAHRQLGNADKATEAFRTALDYYDRQHHIQNGYREMPAEIHRSEIMAELE